MKQFISLLTILFVSLTFSVFYSQSNEIQVSGVKSKSYPEFSAQLSVRNPDKIDESKISFFEGDTELKVTFSDPKVANDVSKNKSVLFVVLNHQAHRDRTRWYQGVLRNAMNKNMMQAGDEFSIVSFDCSRPEYGDIEKQLLFPKNPNFTKNPSDFGSQVNSIDMSKRRHRDNCQKIGDIYGAIVEAIKIMEGLETQNSKSIVVLADDWSGGVVREEIIGKDARKYDIPIYGITYYQNIKRDYGIKDICENSYGAYAIDRSNRVDEMSDRLLEFMNNQIQRASGWVYDISFKSPHNKDGKNHAVRVQYKSDKQITGFQYSDPKQTFSDWVNANMLLFIGLIALFLLVVILIVVFVKKRKRERLEAERLQDEELDRVRSQQENADSKVAQQQQELQNMKAAESAKLQKEEAAKRKKEKEEQDAVKVQEMSARGNLPWFTFDFNGTSGSIEMNAPEFSFGRGKDVSYTLNHKTVSRNHFVVSFDNGSYSIQDLGSSNGTLVNGVKVSQSKLNHGDVIGVGEILLTFHI